MHLYLAVFEMGGGLACSQASETGDADVVVPTLPVGKFASDGGWARLALGLKWGLPTAASSKGSVGAPSIPTAAV